MDKIKREGNGRAHLYIDRIISLLSSNDESYRLIFNNQPANELRDSLILEEFRKLQYFEKLMEDILEKIYKLT